MSKKLSFGEIQDLIKAAAERAFELSRALAAKEGEGVAVAKSHETARAAAQEVGVPLDGDYASSMISAVIATMVAADGKREDTEEAQILITQAVDEYEQTFA